MSNDQTLPELLAKMQEIQRQVETARKTEYAGAVRKVRQLIAEYGIAAKDIGFADPAAPKSGRGAGRGKAAGAEKTPAKRGRKPGSKAGVRASKGSKVAPKYRDPATGATWTGRGKRPRWMADALAAGRTEASFLISGASGSASE